MRLNGSELNSSVLPRDPPAEGAPRRQPWVTSTLAAVLIFTIVVDLLGNLLVVLSVYRNKKLRNAGSIKMMEPMLVDPSCLEERVNDIVRKITNYAASHDNSVKLPVLEWD